MKKIAIKYSEENWANVKVAVDLIRSTGQTVIKRKDSVSLEGVTALRNNWGITPDKFDYSEVSITAMYEEGFTILSMPEDMDKLKEALGIEVPKNGEVYDIVGRVVRFKSKINGKMADLHSQLLDDGTFYAESKQINCMKVLHKATPEEITKLIEAEHANKYHWDGKELVKIPEYIESNCEIYPINKTKPVIYGNAWNIPEPFKCVLISESKPSPREAYETQNMVRLMNEKAHKTLEKIGKEFVDNAREFNEQFSQNPINFDSIEVSADDYTKAVSVLMHSPSPVITGKKTLKRIILNQYEAIEILVDDFEMVHGDGKIIFKSK